MLLCIACCLKKKNGINNKKKIRKEDNAFSGVMALFLHITSHSLISFWVGLKYSRNIESSLRTVGLDPTHTQV